MLPRQFLIILAAFLAACAATTQTPVAEVLAKMPAQNAAEAEANNAALVKLGPSAILETAKALVPPGAGDNTKAEFALNGLAVYVTRRGAEAERKMVAGALIEALQAATDKDVKAFLVRQLQIAGREDAVAPLAALLADETLCEPAAQALLAIRTSEVPAVFAAALKTAQGKNQITIIKALGELRCTPAVGDLLPLAASSDPAVRQTTLFALADIGAPEAAAVLQESVRSASGFDRARAASDYFLYARRRAEAGDSAACEHICRELLKDPEEQVACAALSQLVSLLGDKAFPDLLAAMDSNSKELRGAALRLASAIPGVDASKQWVDKAAHASPELRLEILSMLAQRGDMTAYSALLSAIIDPDKALRLAAIEALPRFSARETVPTLIDLLLRTTEPDEIAALKGALLRCRNDDLLPLAAETLPKAAPPARKIFIELLAARCAERYVGRVIGFTKDSDPAVRLAAIEALANLANAEHMPLLLNLLLTPQNEDEAKAAHRSLVAVVKQNDDVAGRVEPILVALAQQPDDKKAPLLSVLPELGGEKALRATVAGAGSTVAAVRDASIRGLAAWPEAAALPELLKLIPGTAEAEYQGLMVQGYVRLVGAANPTPEEKLRMLKDGLNAAQRPDEKRLVLNALADIRTVEALAVASPCLDDAALKNDACSVVAKIVGPPKEGEPGLKGDEVASALKKVLAITQDQELRKKVEAYLATLGAPSK